ncbi:MAG: hypothetical protein IH957_13365 [Chloroflexi bacterium]|nr:hypothetical protein [Chloroflexota bacterium]
MATKQQRREEMVQLALAHANSGDHVDWQSVETSVRVKYPEFRDYLRMYPHVKDDLDEQCATARGLSD